MDSELSVVAAAAVVPRPDLDQLIVHVEKELSECFSVEEECSLYTEHGCHLDLVVIRKWRSEETYSCVGYQNICKNDNPGHVCMWVDEDDQDDQDEEVGRCYGWRLGGGAKKSVREAVCGLFDEFHNRRLCERCHDVWTTPPRTHCANCLWTLGFWNYKELPDRECIICKKHNYPGDCNSLGGHASTHPGSFFCKFCVRKLPDPKKCPLCRAVISF